MARKVPKKVKSVDAHWVSPVTFDARSFSRLLGELMDKLDYKYDTDQGEKMYSKMYHFVPLPMKFAFVHRFRVSSPAPFIIDLYGTRPNHGGMMHFVEIYDIDQANYNHILTLLEKVVENTPRPPWRFTATQRLQYGAIMPEFRKARKMWEQWGFYTGKEPKSNGAKKE